MGGRMQPEESWISPGALEALVHQCAQKLFAVCREDPRTWLSEADLQAIFYAILWQDFPAHGLPVWALHVGYPCRLPSAEMERLGRRGRAVPVNLGIVFPQSVRLLSRRRWQARLRAALEIKRGYERYREIKDDLAKLAAIQRTWPEVQVWMIIMGYRSPHEDASAIRHLAQSMGVPLLGDNYWGKDRRIEQRELL